MHYRNKYGRYFSTLGLYIACCGILLLTYTKQIADENAYMGMEPWNMSVTGYIILTIGLPVVAWAGSQICGRPSDFFRLFYLTIAVVSFLVLHPVMGTLPPGTILAGIVILIFPLFVVELLDLILPSIKLNGPLKSNWVESLIVLGLLVVVFSSAGNSPASASFEIDRSYDRRLQGREIYAAGSFLAYGLSMAMNGFAPYLAFRAGLKMHRVLFCVALAAVCFFYWLLGVKGPILYVIAAMALGFVVRKNELPNIGRYFLFTLFALGLVVIVEWLSFDEYSIVADYFFRRLFAVQAEVQVYYLQFLLNQKDVPWSWVYGSFDPKFEVTYYVGERYLGNADSNVNTNAFLYQFADKGVVGYILAATFVPFFLVILDRLYQSSRNPSYLFLGFLYALLVVEQAFTVALVSSGVAVLLVLTVLERKFNASR